MKNSMPSYAVMHHRFFLGYVSAVSLRQAKQRARKAFPNKRLEVELAMNVNPSQADILLANRTYQAKLAIGCYDG